MLYLRLRFIHLFCGQPERGCAHAEMNIIVPQAASEGHQLTVEELKASEKSLSKLSPNSPLSDDETKPQSLPAFHDDLDDYPPPWRRVIYMLVALFLVFLAALDITIVSTAIAHITDDFGTVDAVEWYGSAFLISLACTQGFWSSMFELFSLKWGLISSIAIVAAGSLISALSTSSNMLIAGRWVAGFGAASSGVGGTIVHCLLHLFARLQ